LLPAPLRVCREFVIHYVAPAFGRLANSTPGLDYAEDVWTWRKGISRVITADLAMRLWRRFELYRKAKLWRRAEL
jgi:hypothetical protein